MLPKSFAENQGLARLLAASILGCAAAALVSRYLFLHHGVIPGDFEVYLRAWQRVCAGETPYVASEFSPFKYSPGALALVQFLPRDPGLAWQVFGGASIALLLSALLFGVRYRGLRSVGELVLGLLLAWKGILETLDYGQMELMILGLATAAAATFETVPVFSGLMLGLLPGFKLPWVLLFLPFWLASRIEQRRRAHRFRRFLTGYLGGWLFWASALPSLTFGREKALRLSQEWVALLRSQPASLFESDINQSLWITALKLGLPPLVAIGLACVLAGLILGRLVVRSQETASGRIGRGQALAWITPWLVYTQWVNPLAWRWGSALAVGMPFAWERARNRGPRVLRWTLGSWVAFLWLLQQSPFLKLFGIHHWTDLHAYGVISFYWLLLIGLC